MKVLHNIALKSYNSFRTQAMAKLFCKAQTPKELTDVLKEYLNEDKLILGSGYNLFFTKDYDGIVIKPEIKGITILSETNESVEIEAGAAEDWDHFVAYCVEHTFAGIENLSLIPGSVGAAPIQNIGAYGAEVKDVITRVKTIDIETGEQIIFENRDCDFTYRNSIFKQTRRYVVTSVIFKLNKQFKYHEKYIDLNRKLKNIDNPSLAQVRDAVIRIRNQKLPDPALLPNAGSFFKNPILNQAEKSSLLQKLPHAPVYEIGDGQYKTSAAYLIEQAGYKGKRVGEVGTYEHHALIIVNYGTENGQFIADFVQDIQDVVRIQFGICLEPEVWIF